MTSQAGLYNPMGKSLGVTLLDYNHDGWLDLAVANDTEPNFLYRNNGDGTFTDEAVLMGIAFSETGKRAVVWELTPRMSITTAV